jgi:diguanylate cyclase (GGDEF)-like protein/PAS domain S-box-containing protein
MTAAVLSLLPDGVVVTGRDGVILYANGVARALFAPSGQELVGVSVDALVPEGRRDAHAESRTRFHAKPGIRRMQDRRLTARTLDGEPLLVEIHIGPGPDQTAVAVVRDVSDRMVLLQNSRVQLAALTAAANGIMITDRAGKIQWVNPAFTKLTGYAAEELIGRNPRMLKSDWHGTAFYNDMWATISRGAVWKGEVVNRRRDGSLYTEEQAITPVTDHNGVITHFIAIKHDVSARIAVQDALRRDLRGHQVLQALSKAGLDDHADTQQLARAAAGMVRAQLGLRTVRITVLAADGRSGRTFAAGEGWQRVLDETHATLEAMRPAPAEGVWPMDTGGVRQGWLAVDADALTENDVALLSTVAGHMASMIRQHNLQARVVDLAERDVLTGLANRRRLFARGAEEVSRARRYRRQLGVLLIDLDHFKRVNDELGHAAGDAVLAEVGAFLQGAARDSDLAGRYGGEEFAVLLADTSVEGAKRAAERLVSGISELRIQLGGHGIQITTSVGVAALRGTEDTFNDMLNRADRALYAAKRNGRDRWEMADETAVTDAEESVDAS